MIKLEIEPLYKQWYLSNDRKESLKEQQGKKIIAINKIFICSMKLSSFYIWFLLLMLV